MLKTAIVFATVAAILVAGSPRAAATDLLVNGGFEQDVEGWVVASEFSYLEAVDSSVHGGQLAGRLSGSQLTTHKVYQRLHVQGGRSYDFSGWVLLTDPEMLSPTLVIRWLDGSLALIKEVYSTPLPSGEPSAYRFFHVEPIASPLNAQTAQVEVRINANVAFTVYLDDFTFEDVTPPGTPVSPPTLTATSTPPPAAAPTLTPTPSPARTPTRTPTATLTPTPAPQLSPSPSSEPTVFSELVNGGFEQLREDGTAFGWRKQGGNMAVTPSPRHEGSRALVFMSESASTKWVYQAVVVQPGSFYEATARVLNGSGGQAAFLRVSWYSSADASGAALDNADSQSLTGSTPDFRLVTTGPVHPPPNALSAKVRLMLRPISGDPAAAYFDAVTFVETSERPVAGEESGRGPTAAGGRGPVSGRTVAGISRDAESDGAVAAAVATPLRLVNEGRPVSEADVDRASAAGGDPEWPLLLAVASVVGVVALVGWYGWRQRAVRDSEE